METLWFCLAAIVITGYVPLDGFIWARESFSFLWHGPSTKQTKC
jgi:hypothetical protein